MKKITYFDQFGIDSRSWFTASFDLEYQWRKFWVMSSEGFPGRLIELGKYNINAASTGNELDFQAD